MHQLPKVPIEETKRRIQLFQHELHTMDLDGALIVQNVDFFYFTGTMQNGLIYIPKQGEPQLYIKKSLARAESETSLPVTSLGRMRDLGIRIEQQYGSVKRVGFELDVLPYQQATRYFSLFPNAKPIDISSALRAQRAVKSAYELVHIRTAAQKVNQVFASLPTLIRPGISEIELAARIEQALRLQGNLNLYRMRGFNQELVLGMVAAGAQAATPTSFDGPAGGLGLSIAGPQGASHKKINPGDPILVDIGTTCEGYLIDQTRLAVIGELADDFKHVYHVAQQILREVEQLAKPDASWESLWLKATEHVVEAGLQDYFMGYGKDQAKFLGHGIGLELDELPILAKGFQQPLIEGMVIAIEPKFTFPGRGVIGLENTYVVTASGLESISLTSEEIIHIDG